MSIADRKPEDELEGIHGPTGPTAFLRRVLDGKGPARRAEIERLVAEVDEFQAELEAQNRELHIVQLELAESRDRYFELYELAPVSYLTLDAQGTILESNLGLATLLCSPRQQLIGRPLSAFIAEEQAELFALELRRLFGSRRRITTDLVICRADGTRRYARLDAVARETGEGPPQARAVLTDVNELKEAERHIRLLNAELAERIDELTKKNRQLAREIEHRAQLSDSVEHSQDELRRLSRRVISLQDEERGRIARELHDETGQALGAIVAELRGLEDRDDDDAVKAVARRVRERVSSALRDVRRIAQGLHPSSLASCGLQTALERLFADQANTRGLTVTTQLGGLTREERLPPDIELALYRVAQEALTNVVKHAHATRVSVVLVKHGDRVRLVVEDDGCGFDPAALPDDACLGLIGMRERIGQLGGEIHMESQPDKGTTLAVSVPLERAHASDSNTHRR